MPPKPSQPAQAGYVAFTTYWKRDDLKRVRQEAAEQQISANQLIVQSTLKALEGE